MKEIASALVKAQRAFGPALKTHNNPAFKSKYADLSACIEAVMDALNSNGIALIQQCHDTESGVTVETVFLHESGESWSAGKLHVPAAKQDPQGYGSALTYARRYSLMAACGIAPEDDDGNAAARPPPERRIALPHATEIKDLLREAGADPVAFLAWVSKGAGEQIKSVDTMPASAYAPAIKQLKAKLQEKTS